MLTEPPGEALARTSTFTLFTDRPGCVDLTIVYKQLGASPAEEYIWVEETINGGTSNSLATRSATITGHPLHTKAIYKIEGEYLTYCVAAPGRPRPTEFVTKKGDECTLVSLQHEAVSSNLIRTRITSDLPQAFSFFHRPQIH